MTDEFNPDMYELNNEEYNSFIKLLKGKETSEIELYLPAGLWEHLWSEEVYGDENSGTYVKVEAPVGKPAVFFKKGSKHGEDLKKSLSF